MEQGMKRSLPTWGLWKRESFKNLKLRTDSKLIVGQITNEYEEKEERMKRHLKLTNQLIGDFDDIRFE